jgi:predicted NUDIX family NTP pyrophosphohydrolase
VLWEPHVQCSLAELLLLDLVATVLSTMAAAISHPHGPFWENGAAGCWLLLAAGCCAAAAEFRAKQ